MILPKSLLTRFFLEGLEQGIVKGTLHVITPEGTTHIFKGSVAGREAVWHIHQWEVAEALLQRGDIGLGETYAQGGWDSPNLEDLFVVFVDNLPSLETLANGTKFQRFWLGIINRVWRRNNPQGSARNIRSHYDVGNAFYKLWLDPSMTYSSALFSNPALSLQQAQQQKYQRILKRITPNRRDILEVGCGWGGFAEEALKSGHRLTGLTLSQEQHRYAQQRLGAHADIRLQDYRHTKSRFDAIASIEMFEAVGRQYWPSYFSTLKHNLSKDGVAIIQTITIQDNVFEDYSRRSDYIRHYIFPGGLLPSVGAFRQEAEKSGFSCRDIFSFGQDYARTLQEWRSRFDKAEPQIRALGHDNNFIRSWRLYLSMCAASFLCGRTNVVQVELAHA